MVLTEDMSLEKMELFRILVTVERGQERPIPSTQEPELGVFVW